MASTTDEVLLHFGTDDVKFRVAVDMLRFMSSTELTSREIIGILSPVWQVAHQEGYADGTE